MATRERGHRGFNNFGGCSWDTINKLFPSLIIIGFDRSPLTYNSTQPIHVYTRLDDR